MNNTYAIFTEDLSSNLDLVNNIKSFLIKQFILTDFIVFTNEINFTTTEYGILTPFYMVAYKGNMIFLNIEDYLHYKDSMNSQNIIYLTDVPTVDRSLIKNCKIISNINNELVWIKLYELQ